MRKGGEGYDDDDDDDDGEERERDLQISDLMEKPCDEVLFDMCYGHTFPASLST